MNGQGESIELLRGIWNEMRTLNGRVNTLRTELKAEIGQLRTETREGFALLGGRIDRLLVGPHGEEHARLAARVDRIESHLRLPALLRSRKRPTS